MQLPSPGELPLEGTAPSARNLLTLIVREVLPEEHIDDRKWGMTTQRWDGLKVKMDGLQIKTKRRWKEVNHGTWRRYHLSLVDPDEYFRVHLVEAQRTAPGTCDCLVRIQARLDLYGRIQEWNRGIRLASLSAEATADLEVDARLQVATSLDMGHFPPDVLIVPRVEELNIRLKDLRLHRLSKAHGPVVDEIGDALEKVARRRLTQKKEKLTAKINSKLEKKQDDLRISLSELVRKKWLGLAPEPTTPLDPPPNTETSEHRPTTGSVGLHPAGTP